MTTPESFLQPGSDAFDEARALWNVRFDRTPDTIARCETPDEVAAVIRYAVQQNLGLSVKGGGHSYAANSVRDGGILIDLSPQKSIDVDPAGRTVTIGGGVTVGELDSATQAYGLATPAPTASSVGVVGAALGGGSGYLARRFGLTLDNVLSATLVTANGDIVAASNDDNPDLFWAIRGGGGNYGVVTSLELQLHAVGPEVLSGQIIYPFDDAGSHLRFFRDFMSEAPEEFQCYPFCFRIPPIDLFPEDTHGQPVVDFVVCHQDPAAADFVEPLRKLGEPILDAVGPGSYLDTQRAFDANLPKGQRYLSKAHDLDWLSDGAIDTMVEFVPDMVGDLTAAYFDPLGGAISRVDQSATAYAGRSTQFGFHVIAGWTAESEDERVIDWATAFHKAMSEHSNGGVYVNLIGDDESPKRVLDAYGANYARLVNLKSKWDPANIFGSNYNIPPS